MSELTGPLKFYAYATAGFASLSALCFLGQLTLIFIDFSAFVRALIGLPLSLLLALIEFRDIPALFNYASFYYSYLGRGFLLLLLTSLLSFGTVFSIILGVFLFAGSVLHFVLHALPDAPEPASFKRGATALTVGNDDDDII